MNVVFYLGTCSTCKRIMDSLTGLEKLEKREIKSQSIRPEEIDLMRSFSGSFEALFSRVALKYRAMGLNEKKLSEKDYRKLILEEYTFLKRPVFIIEDQIFIGNSKAVIEKVQTALSK